MERKLHHDFEEHSAWVVGEGVGQWDAKGMASVPEASELQTFLHGPAHKGVEEEPTME